MRSSPSPCQDAVPAMFLVGRRHLALALQLCGARGGGVVAASAFRGRHRRRAHRPGRRRRKGGARRRKGCRRGCLPGRGELGGAQARARAERPAAVAARRRRPDAGGVRTADGARAPSPSRLAGGRRARSPQGNAGRRRRRHGRRVLPAGPAGEGGAAVERRAAARRHQARRERGGLVCGRPARPLPKAAVRREGRGLAYCSQFSVRRSGMQEKILAAV
mmetsp:Transcript_13348/g.44942  ORF Transcript_13348/g.44942 Transcript_13348/m.44942 type:complete len:219 (+) Transcript_13348:107-763(+)